MNSSGKLLTNIHRNRNRRRKKKKTPLPYILELHTYFHDHQDKFLHFPRSDMINEIDKNGNIQELIIFYDA